MSGIDQKRMMQFLVAALLAASVVFTLWPEIDLTVSRWFYRPGEGFWLADLAIVNALREAVRITLYLTPAVALILFPAALLGFRPWRVPARIWGFVFLLFVIGPLFLANVVLKNNWGRARPSQVTDFGGEARFSPALRWVSECDFNCSFVSGEGAGATALAVTILLVAPYALKGLPRERAFRVTGGLLLVPAAGLLLRVLMGRHFLSDTVFAVLLVLAVAAVLHPLIVGRVPHPRTGKP